MKIDKNQKDITPVFALLAVSVVLAIQTSRKWNCCKCVNGNIQKS